MCNGYLGFHYAVSEAPYEILKYSLLDRFLVEIILVFCFICAWLVTLYAQLYRCSISRGYLIFSILLCPGSGAIFCICWVLRSTWSSCTYGHLSFPVGYKMCACSWFISFGHLYQLSSLVAQLVSGNLRDLLECITRRC